MAPVLARVTRRVFRLQWLVAALICLLAAQAEGHAEYTVEVVTETEAWAFLSDSYLAKQRCDDQWVEQHMDPSATLTIAIRGEPTITGNRDDHLRWFREECRFYMRQPFSKSGWSVSVSPYGTTVRWAGETKEANLPGFIWFPRKPGSGEVVMTLIKVGGIVQIRDVQEAYRLDKQEDTSR